MSELTEQIRATCDSIAENQKKVYDLGFEQGKNLGGYSEGFEAGKKSQYDEFWDNYQDNGNRTNYNNAFRGYGWTAETFKPKYDIVPTFASGLFGGTQNFKGSLRDVFERRGLKLDLSKTTSCDDMFNAMNYVTDLPFIDLSSVTGSSMIGTFYGLRLITSLQIKLPEKEKKFSNFVRDLRALEDFEITGGIIGGDGFDVQWSTKLSKASWISIMTAASTTASITITGSLVSVNKAFETSDGANDGSTSPEWLALKAARPTVSVSLV